MSAGVLSFLPCWRGFAGGRWSAGVLSARAAPEYLGSSSGPERCSLSALGPQRRLQTPKSRFTPESRWFTAPEWDNDWASSWPEVHRTRRRFATTSRENYGARSPAGTRGCSLAYRTGRRDASESGVLVGEHADGCQASARRGGRIARCSMHGSVNDLRIQRSARCAKLLRHILIGPDRDHPFALAAATRHPPHRGGDLVAIEAVDDVDDRFDGWFEQVVIQSRPVGLGAREERVSRAPEATP